MKFAITLINYSAYPVIIYIIIIIIIIPKLR